MLETKKELYAGHIRTLYKTNCASCSAEIWRPKFLLKNERNFCNINCSRKPKKTVNVNCFTCNKELARSPSKLKGSKSQYYFCNRGCKAQAQKIISDKTCKAIQPAHYGKHNVGYRKAALRIHGSICKKCGYNTYNEMLDVHHLDSDRTNNSITNLEVLCVWCHALETRNIPNHRF